MSCDKIFRVYILSIVAILYKYRGNTYNGYIR